MKLITPGVWNDARVRWENWAQKESRKLTPSARVMLVENRRAHDRICSPPSLVRRPVLPSAIPVVFFFYSFPFCRPLSLIIRCIIVSFCSRCTIFFIMFFLFLFYYYCPNMLLPVNPCLRTQHYHVMINPLQCCTYSIHSLCLSISILIERFIGLG